MTAHRFVNWCLAAAIAAILALVWDQPDPDPKLTAQQRAARLAADQCANGFWIWLDDQTIECRVRQVRGPIPKPQPTKELK